MLTDVEPHHDFVDAGAMLQSMPYALVTVT